MYQTYSCRDLSIAYNYEVIFISTKYGSLYFLRKLIVILSYVLRLDNIDAPFIDWSKPLATYENHGRFNADVKINVFIRLSLFYSGNISSRRVCSFS